MQKQLHHDEKPALLNAKHIPYHTNKIQQPKPGNTNHANNNTCQPQPEDVKHLAGNDLANHTANWNHFNAMLYPNNLFYVLMSTN